MYGPDFSALIEFAVANTLSSYTLSSYMDESSTLVLKLTKQHVRDPTASTINIIGTKIENVMNAYEY